MRDNPSHLVYIVLSPILSTCFALINVVAIFIFYTRFHLATLALIIIVNICACDIFVCMISNTFYVANILHPVHAWSTGSVCCKLFKFFTMLSNVAQIFLLVVLNADRLRRLVHSSVNQWKKRHGIIFTSICWIKATLLCLPRLVLFDVETTEILATNRTDSFDIYNCKPVGMDVIGFSTITIMTFVLAYALPALFMIYSLVRSQLFMWKRRRCIHIATTSNAVTRMNGKLSLTFNLTGALFMIIWTPFFVLSLLDLHMGIMNNKQFMLENFALRCTLLIFGSSKPLIYLLCLDRFRQSFRCTIQNKSENSKTIPNATTNLQTLSGSSRGIKTIDQSTVC